MISIHSRRWVYVGMKCSAPCTGHSRCLIQDSHYCYYCSFTYHRSKRVAISDDILAGLENRRQLWWQSKAGPLSPRARGRASCGFQSLFGSSPARPPIPALLPVAWPPLAWPGGLEDLRPPARMLGARFPVQMPVRSSVGRNPPLGLCTATIAKCVLAAGVFGIEIQMGSN